MNARVEELLQSILGSIKRVGELNREGYELADLPETLKKIDEELGDALFNIEE